MTLIFESLAVSGNLNLLPSKALKTILLRPSEPLPSKSGLTPS